MLLLLNVRLLTAQFNGLRGHSNITKINLNEPNKLFLMHSYTWLATDDTQLSVAVFKWVG